MNSSNCNLPPNTRLFPRGDGPLVSVLLPSRGRPQGLIASILSFYDRALEPSRVECLIKIDLDDVESQAALAALAVTRPNLPIGIICSERGNGYADFHLWINDLASRSQGDWLLAWNDDAQMLTEHWDEKIEKMWYSASNTRVNRLWKAADDFGVFYLDVEGSLGSTAFPLVRRKLTEVLGHYALDPCCDTWIMDVVSPLGIGWQMPYVKVRHRIYVDQPDGQDQTAREAMAFFAIPEDEGALNIAEGKSRDSLKLINYLRKLKM
ncbi:MAG: hypothetical protein KGL39_00695 [Patescibacteria group bacterium]|nr:hypothetical protein [Patescibacteria group bacterium]